MLDLDSRAHARDGVTLVRLRLENPTATARRVRIANRLDGPVWPPRCEGVPEAGWDDGGFEGVVAAGERLALGYACPVESPADQPAEVCWTERARTCDGTASLDIRAETDASASAHSAESVVRTLGDPTPPGDAVPVPEPADDAALVPEDEP